MDFIKDGTGHCYTAKVNSNHELQTRSTSLPLESTKAIDGDLYLATTGILPVTTTEGLMCWLYFSDTINSLALSSMTLSWNGGSTNHNRAIEIYTRAGTGAPSGNLSVAALRNTNTSSSNTLLASTYAWDGVGTGITGASQALEVSLSDYILTQGATNILIQGRVILGPGTTIALYTKAEETGNFSAIFYFNLLKPGTDL